MADVVFVRAGFDGDARFYQNVGGTQDFFAGIAKVSEVMETAARAGVIAGDGQVVAFVGGTQPCTSFGSIVKNNLFCDAQAQHLAEEFAAGFDVGSE